MESHNLASYTSLPGQRINIYSKNTYSCLCQRPGTLLLLITITMTLEFIINHLNNLITRSLINFNLKYELYKLLIIIISSKIISILTK